MAHTKNRGRGMSSHARRRIREESYVKTLNRKRNHQGCTSRGKRDS